jgi:tRNA nucleotidyltransferase (CCA-adding enzyme)
MKVYRVGGAVRDEMLGRPVTDVDHVVVGATPEDMVRLGYRPVGKDFPVFLHPETHEEYALARTERKTARGYHGFAFHTSPDVTLEQDLARRDLTINAMARDDAGTLVDPYHGAEDLKAGILRHVSPAFAEDPVRILRLARFAARFQFTVAPETAGLMRAMVKSGEADALVAERVWQEISRGLMENRPAIMFAVLDECGALERVFPEIAESFRAADAHGGLPGRLDAAAADGLPLEGRFGVLMRELDPIAVERLGDRLRVPGACRDAGKLVARHANAFAAAASLDAASLLDLFDATDLWRKPDRFTVITDAALLGEDDDGSAADTLHQARDAALSVNPGAIAKSVAPGEASGEIRELVREARLGAIERALDHETSRGGVART